MSILVTKHTRLRNLTVLFAAIVMPGGASAQTLADLLKNSSPEELATAFKAICLDHPSDAAGEATAAQAAPWTLKLDGKAGKRSAVYRAWPLQLTLSDQSTTESCMLTSSMSENLTLADVAEKATAALAITNAKPRIASDTVYWTTEDNAEGKSIAFKMFPGAGTKVGNFILVTRKAAK